MGIIALNETNRSKEAMSGNVIGYRKAFFAHLTGLLPNIVPVSLLKSRLFGVINNENAYVKDLEVINPNIDISMEGGPDVSGNIGGIVGQVWYGSITGCCVLGGNINAFNDIVISANGSNGVGGIAGDNVRGEIVDCHTSINLSGDRKIGGIAGYNGGLISECHATGNINGVKILGGLVGENIGDILYCYSTGNISGLGLCAGLVGVHHVGSISNSYSVCDSITCGEAAGGLVAANANGATIQQCFSTGNTPFGIVESGGLVGRNQSVGTLIVDSLWDVNTNGHLNMCGDVIDGASGCDNSYGKTTAEMRMQSTFEAEGWDFVGESVNGTEDIWLMPCEGRDYPSLAWQQKTCLFADVSSFNFVGEYQGANPVVQVLTIESIGPGGVNWQIDESCDWLEATPAAGFLEDGTTPITIAVDTTGLERGFYDCTMTVTGDTSETRTMSVQLHVFTPSERHVPGEYATIQAAIDAAETGDRVIVQPGVHNENIHFFNRNDVELTSIDPDDPAVVASTVIQGNGSASVVRFDDINGPLMRVQGFTITGGSASYGGGVHGNGCPASLYRCVIENNQAGTNGGGIFDLDGPISYCEIRGNRAGNHGGGAAGCDGGLNNCDGPILHCTIADNRCEAALGGIRSCDGAITNNIVWNNEGSEIFNSSPPTFCCIEDWDQGGEGNISSDPLFVFSDNYHITCVSPCIDAGSDAASAGLDSDLDLYARRVDGDEDGTARVDMGAYEVQNAAVMVVDPEGFSITYEGHSPLTTLSLQLANVGLQALNWQSSSDCNWVAITPAGGQIATGIAPLEIEVDVATLSYGIHTCQVVLSDDQALNSVLAVPVQLDYRVLAVPDDFNSIQAAIDAAQTGSIIVVSPGSYVENINFNGKAIEVRSVDPTDPSVVAGTIIDGNGADTVVRFENGEGRDSILNGLTIRNGVTAGEGGGIVCSNAGPMITYCVIENNSAYGGGGMYNVSSAPVVNYCVFRGNQSQIGGGGIRNDGAYAIIEHCEFYDNTAGSGSGLLETNSSRSRISHCTFNANTAVNTGGALRCNRSSESYVWNSIFWGNTAPTGHEIAVTEAADASILHLDYCDVQGGAAEVMVDTNNTLDWGEGMFEADPLFADAANRDFHLQSQAGRWDPTQGMFVADAATSVCIDAGDPDSDYQEELCPHGSRVNMGAYGNSVQASHSLTGVVTGLEIPGDINNDCVINLADLNLLIQAWLLDYNVVFEKRWDVRADYSEASNPAGPWSYRHGNSGVLLQFSSAGTGGNAPAGWDNAGNLPSLFTGPWGPASIGIHDMGSHGPLLVRWESPFDGQVEIGGFGFAPDLEISRLMHWSILKNGSVLTEGDFLPDFSVVDFADGSNGPGVLTLSVVVGDTIDFQCVGNGLDPLSTFFGFNLFIQQLSGQVSEPLPAGYDLHQDGFINIPDFSILSGNWLLGEN